MNARVLASSVAQLKDRLGATTVERTSMLGFRHRAAVPARHWRTPSSHVVSGLRAEALGLADVGVLKVPPTVLSQRDLTTIAASATGAHRLSMGPECRDALDSLGRWTRGLLDEDRGGWTELPLRAEMARNSLGVTTYDPADGRHIGLHLDSFDSEPLERRHLSRTRICVNLGTGSRYLLFARSTIQEVAAQACQTFLSAELLADLPSIRCAFRLRVDPGEAYVAPTELLLHDGQVADAARPDVSATYIGHFAALKVQRASAI